MHISTYLVHQYLIWNVTMFTRAQYAGGLCVCVRRYIYMCVCRQKTRLFASYRSKISTKTLSAASPLNL